MHNIAQNCVQNDQKLSAVVEEVGGGGVRRENWGRESAMAVGRIDAPGCRHYILTPYFAIFAAFKESMTLNLAQGSFKVIHFGGNRKPVYDFI